MRSEDDRIEFRKVSNGFVLYFEEWDKEQKQWDIVRTEVYQDPETVLGVLKEHIMSGYGVTGG